MDRVIGKKVILHNHKNQIGVLTHFQDNQKPVVVELLDSEGKYQFEFVGSVKRRKKALTANWSWYKLPINANAVKGIS